MVCLGLSVLGCMTADIVEIIKTNKELKEEGISLGYIN